MIITRWQAEMLPTKEQVKILFELEGLDFIEEIFLSNEKIVDHRHPFCEIRVILEGEMLFNISGNQILLRAGDRVEIPANTKHHYFIQGNSPCISLLAHKVI